MEYRFGLRYVPVRGKNHPYWELTSFGQVAGEKLDGVVDE